MQTMQNNTVAAIATPAGAGAVGIVRLSGPQAIQIADKIFTPKAKDKALHQLAGYSGCFGTVGDSAGIIDEAVAYVYRAPKSYTGEDVVELCSHGSTYLLQRVLAALLQAGAGAAPAGEFTKRAFLNGKLSLDQAEAVMDIISAQGQMAAQAALSAKEGALGNAIDGCTNGLIDVLAHITAWVDYPEEDVPALEQAPLLADIQQALSFLQGLQQSYDKGRLVKNGVDTVIVGRPNVGKSTLMNRLSGTARSIVTPLPGTTRDIVEEEIRLGDITLLLSDTAGLRETQDIIEQEGVRRTRARLESAQLCLAIFDGGQSLTAEDRALLTQLQGRLCIAVISKMDQKSKIQKVEIQEKIQIVVEISAQTGQGIDALEAAILQALGLGQLDTAAPMVATHRQLDCVLRGIDALEKAQEAVLEGQPLDITGICLEQCIAALLELTGKNASATVVERAFENFCVGK